MSESTCALSCSTDENAIMYFNLTGDKDAAKSQPYTEPFEMTINGTVYAFANGYADLLASEMAQAEVVVGEQKSYTEILAYFKGADATLNNADLPNGYNFKNGWNFYDPENLIGEDIVDGELVSVYDVMGRTVAQSFSHSATQSLRIPLHSGVYMVRIGNRPAHKVVVIE